MKDRRAYYKEYNRNRYKNLVYKNYIISKNRKRRQVTSEWLREYKQTLICERCSESHPACLDFHHIDPKQKQDVIKLRRSISSLKKEIQKCIVLCANCHRKEHYKGGS